MKFLSGLILTVHCLTGFCAIGDTVAQTPTTTPKTYDTPPIAIQMENGKPINLKWPDGKEAEVQKSNGPLSILRAPFQVVENLCNGKMSMKCTMDIQYLPVTIKLVWTKNADPSKIGKIVKSTPYPGNPLSELSYDVFVDYSLKRYAPIASQIVEGPEFTCQDYSWIPGGSIQSPPEQAWITHWNNEYMFMNPETGINENHSESGMLGVELVKSPQGHLKVKNIRQAAVIQQGIPAYIGESTSLFFKPSPLTKNLCQVSLKPNFKDAALGISDSIMIIHNSPGAPYIYGTDELLKLTQGLSQKIMGLNVKDEQNDAQGKKVTHYHEAEVQ